MNQIHDLILELRYDVVERIPQLLLNRYLVLVLSIAEFRIVGKQNFKRGVLVLIQNHSTDAVHQCLNFWIAFPMEITSENGFFRMSVALKMRFEKDAERRVFMVN